MLTFNLEKADRETLRRRIAMGDLTAEALSVMTNAELASEQQKKEIEHAHQESLQHSILDASGIDRPIRKITHKGEEEIEDISKGDKDSSSWSAGTVEGRRMEAPRKMSFSDSNMEQAAQDPTLTPISSSTGLAPLSPQHSYEKDGVDAAQSRNVVSLIREDAHTSLKEFSESGKIVSSMLTDSSLQSVPFNVNAISWSPRIDDIDLAGVASGGSPLITATDQLASNLDDADDNHTFDHDFNELLGLDPLEQHSSVEEKPLSQSFTVWTGEVRLVSSLSNPPNLY